MNIAQNAISEINAVYEKTREACEKLTQELSFNERETCDILHFIEFEDFSLDVGYYTTLKLKKLRVARRKIKDELEPLQILTSMLDSQKLVEIQKRIDTKINKQDDRHYTPRVIMGGLADVVNN